MLSRFLPQQLRLPFRFRSEGVAWQPADQPGGEGLESELRNKFGAKVHLTWTQNRSSLLSSRWSAGAWVVRAHEMFKQAPPDVQAALARYLHKRDRRAGAKLDVYISEHRHLIASSRQRRAARRRAGKHYELQRLFDALNERYFAGALQGVELCWGRASRRTGRSSLHLGTYYPSERLIRIHPVLDQSWVPERYISFVLYHEMLHHALGAIQGNQRNRYHTKEFRQREKHFEGYGEVVAWGDKHLPKLLRSANRLGR